MLQAEGYSHGDALKKARDVHKEMFPDSTANLSMAAFIHVDMCDTDPEFDEEKQAGNPQVADTPACINEQAEDANKM